MKKTDRIAGFIYLKDMIIATIATLSILTFTRCAEVDPGLPNILWITTEDISPHLGCYGDPDAYTPNLDNLADRSIRFTNAYAPAPVCTPARSSLITGIHACALGSQHLRGEVVKSDEIIFFPELLREKGYYCSNNSKEDYNFKTPTGVWDESSKTAHWRGRVEGQPFFSVFNLELTHQSQTRYPVGKLKQISDTLPPEARHDPAQLSLPPYYPDTRVVRENLAALHTQITLMDRKVKQLLDQLDHDGLAENTIVFFYSDHGSGLPRGKRWIHDTGTRVPMIICLPERWRHLSALPPGSTDDRLINFTDLASTMLTLAGLEVPAYMKGIPILGGRSERDREYLYTMRDRVDEALEFSRAVRNDRYHYIRNFYPHRPRMQRSFYSELTPIRQEIRRLDSAGLLTGAEKWLMAPVKPAEELYDIKNDPFELRNLAGDPAHGEILDEMKGSLFNWMVEIRDLSLLPEAQMHRRAGDLAPYDMARQPGKFPVGEILKTADLVGRGPGKVGQLTEALRHNDPAIRFWGATGLAALGSDARPAREALLSGLEDDTPSVRFAAVEALYHLGNRDAWHEILAAGLSDPDPRVRLHAVQTVVVTTGNAGSLERELEKVIVESEQHGALGWCTREASSWLLHRAKQYD